MQLLIYGVNSVDQKRFTDYITVAPRNLKPQADTQFARVWMYLEKKTRCSGAAI